MKKIKINKNNAWGFLFLSIFILAFIMIYETDFSKSFGDKFLDGIGLKAWSNGNTGLHYTFFLFISMVVAGYTGTRHFLKDEYPKIAKRMPVIIILLLLFTQPVMSSVNGVVKSYSKGLNAIEYISDGSKMDFKSNEDDTHLRFDCSINLKNYGQEKLVFYIKYFPNEYIKADYVEDEYAIAVDDNGKPREFILSPKSETILNATFEMKQKQSIHSGVGSISRFSIALFNDHQTKEFRYRND